MKTEKQMFADVLQNRCSLKFLKFHRKTPVLESLFNKVAGLCCSDKCFLTISIRFLRKQR